MADFGLQGHGPYPDDWSPAAQEFWDTEPANYRELYNESEWQDLQEGFDVGFLHPRVNDPYSKDEINDGRILYFETAGNPWSYSKNGFVGSASFDWEAYREFLIAIGTPTI